MTRLKSESGGALAQIMTGLAVITLVIGAITMSVSLSNRIRGGQITLREMMEYDRRVKLVLSQISNCTCNLKGVRFAADSTADISLVRIKTFEDTYNCTDRSGDLLLGRSGHRIGSVTVKEIALRNLSRVEDSPVYQADLTIQVEVTRQNNAVKAQVSSIPLQIMTEVLDNVATIESCLFRPEI